MSPAGGGRATRPTLGPGQGPGRSLSLARRTRPPSLGSPRRWPSGLPGRGRLTWPPLFSVRNWYWMLWSPNAACWTLAMATAVCSSAPGPSPPVGAAGQGVRSAGRAGVPRRPRPATPARAAAPVAPQALTFLQLDALLGLGSLVVAAGAHEGQGPGSVRPTARPGRSGPPVAPPGPGPARVNSVAEPPPGSPPRGLHFEPGPEAARDHGGPRARG